MPIYLDNNATTPLAPQAFEAMVPFLRDYYGNPSSIHDFGKPVARAIEVARQQVANLLRADLASEIVFTSGATEANNTAILSALEAQPQRNEIITSAVEHPAVLALCDHLASKGYLIHRIAVDGQGRLDHAAFSAALSERVAVVSLMWANNETGTLFPVLELAEEAKAVGALVHVDGVQVIGKLPVAVGRSAIDFLSLSAHKFNGPKGVGALYVRRGTRFKPLIRGGHQERGRRAGTENVAGIVGFGVAAELAALRLPAMAVVAALRDELEQALLASIPNSFVTGDVANRVPNTTTIAFEYVEGEAILLLLNQLGIAASSGSACTSGSLEPSHVMRAMGVPYTAAHGAIRFSLSTLTTPDDVQQVSRAMPGIIARLRALSPYWQGDGPLAGSFNPEFMGAA